MVLLVFTASPVTPMAKHLLTHFGTFTVVVRVTTRPFGDAVIDGFDLDIEGGGPTGYAVSNNDSFPFSLYLIFYPSRP